MKIDVNYLRTILDYNHETGALTWKLRTDVPASWNTRRAGKPALTALTAGYPSGRINRKHVYAHRVAWAIYYGEWPDGEVDHINCDRTDNRIENLRLASHSQNGMNKKRQRNNTSGFKGVWLRRDTGRWTSEVGVMGGKIRLGCFDTREEASRAYLSAAQRVHGEYARSS